jgi:hypothetical protein
MSEVYTKLHGTTADRFKIGLKNQRVTLSGVTDEGSASIVLLDRDGLKCSVDSTVFFTAYIIGKGVNTAAYEIKGCYLQGTTIVSGYVVDTFVDTAGFVEPSINFNTAGEFTITCTGVIGDAITWTAVIDVVSI